MKKLFLFFVLLCLSAPAMAGALSNGAKTVEGWFGGDQVACPACQLCGTVCKDTPISEINRPFLEFEIGLDALVKPSSGSEQVKPENYHIRLIHNLSPAFYIYTSFAAVTVDKNDYEDTPYDSKWSSKVFMAGAGMYLTPVCKIYGGLGHVLTENVAGNEELATPYEWGVGWDIPISGYKITIGWKSITASLKEDSPSVMMAPADGSMTVGYVSLSLPIVRL